MSDSPEELPTVPLLYLTAGGQQLYLHSDTPSAEDWPVSLETEDNIQWFLMDDGQLAMSNGLQLFVNPPLDLESLKSDGETELAETEDFGVCVGPAINLSYLVETSYDDLNEQLGEQDLEEEAMSPDLEEPYSSSDVAEDEVGEPSDALSSFVDVVTTFKCRMCLHSATSRSQLIEHIKKDHIVVNKTTTQPSPSPPIPEQEVPSPSENSEHSEHGSEDPNVAEKMVFLCAQCAEAFDSLEACRKHMVEDHRLVTEEQDRKALATPSPPVVASTPSPVPPEQLVKVVEETPAPVEQLEEPVMEQPQERAKRQIRLPKSLGEEFHVGKNSKKDGKIRCPSVGCSAKFASEKELDQHDLCHNSKDRNFRCCECGKQFDKWKPCAVHLWNQHKIDVGMLTCTICGQKTSTAMKMTNHMRVHSDARDFTCSVCNKAFKQLTQLKNHSVIHLDKRSIPPGAEPRWYTAKECHICHKTYADSKCLKKHLVAVHGRIRPYTCTVCGHTSARKAMMQLHLRQHTGEKPYSCDVCSFRTGDHNSLRRHKMRHTGTKPYKCPHCNYASIQSNSYKNHLKNRHPDKEEGAFECTTCSFRCVSEEAYIGHLGDHKREQKALQSQMQINDELFPGNVAAAKFIFRCLNTLNHPDGRNVRANIASQLTSADGSEQTITIQIPADSNDAVDDGCIRVEDLVAQRPVDEPDLGGITIPADPTPPPEELPPSPPQITDLPLSTYHLPELPITESISTS